MRKLLLVLFLFALTSNALAKVEIWECDILGPPKEVYKIDTSIPMVYVRYQGEWAELFKTVVFEYSEEDQSILMKDSNGDIAQVFDLLLMHNLHINTNTGEQYHQFDCEEIE